MHRRLLCLLPAVALACDPSGSKSADTSAPGGSDTGSAGTTDDSGDTGDNEPAAEGCRAQPRDADADRALLVNLAYDGDGTGWTVFTLSADGSLTPTGASFSGGRTYLNPGVFTPDGSLGVVALDDGTLAFFAVDDSGGVTVVETGFTTGFYAESLAMHPSGERLYIADRNWVENGGGVYVLDLDCETGLPSLPTDLPLDSLGRLAEAKLPGGILTVPGRLDRLVMVAGEGRTDVTLLDANTGEALDQIDAFLDDDDAWLATGAITPAGDLVLVTDTSSWSARENAVAAITLAGDSLGHAGIDDLFDGVGIGIGADGTTAVVSSGFGDDILRLSLDASAADAVSVEGSLSTTGGRPQIPGGIVTVQRGSLAGTSLVAEVTGIRQLALGPDGMATDLGVTGGITNPAGMLLQP